MYSWSLLVIPCDMGPLIEQAWIERLMSGCGSVKIQCLEHLTYSSQSMVFVVMIHKQHLKPLAYDMHQKVTDTVQKLGLSRANHVMVHIGDEWELDRGVWSPSGHLEDPASSSLKQIYRPWKKVFRQFDNGMDTYFPLGWTPKFFKWDMYKRRGGPASDRGHALSFIGTSWAGRGDQFEAYQQGLQASGLTLNRDKDQIANSTLDQDVYNRYNDEDPRYSQTLANSIFCLQLAGASTECYRLYEALEVGCIPLAQPSWYWQNFAARVGGKYGKMGYASALPFLFADPENAGMKIRELLADPKRLNKLQAQNVAWWDKVKRKYTSAFSQAICPHKKHKAGWGDWLPDVPELPDVPDLPVLKASSAGFHAPYMDSEGNEIIDNGQAGKTQRVKYHP